MPVIFLSYRRADSQDVTGRIYDRLIFKFSPKQVFKDVDNIPLGVSFPMHIKQMLSKATAVLVIIGPDWTTATDEQGCRRLDDPNDFVRVEIEVALRANLPVIPILVSNAKMPKASDLPPSLQKLLSRNGMAVRPDPDFNRDVARLFTGIEHLERIVSAKPAKLTKSKEVNPTVLPPKNTKGKARRPTSKPKQTVSPESPVRPDRPQPRRRRLRVFLLMLALLLGGTIGFFGAAFIAYEMDTSPPWRHVRPIVDMFRPTPQDAKIPGARSDKDPRPSILDCTGPNGADKRRVKTAQKEWADFLKLQVVETQDIGNGVTLEMVLVPPGKFMMGSPFGESGHRENEKLHEVELTRPYYVGKFLVTQEQYTHVMQVANECWFSSTGNGKERVNGIDTKRFPMERVSYKNAEEFCMRMSKRGASKFSSFRLPSEAEWEYACRAGTRTPFHFGEVLNGAEANCNGEYPYGTGINGNYLRRTSQVGSYAGNALELFDMHGNVWQWCQDSLRDYDGSKQLDPLGPPNGQTRAIRGGSWYETGIHCRAAHRGKFWSNQLNEDTGFRVVAIPRLSD